MSTDRVMWMGPIDRHHNPRYHMIGGRSDRFGPACNQYGIFPNRGTVAEAEDDGMTRCRKCPWEDNPQ